MIIYRNHSTGHSLPSIDLTFNDKYLSVFSLTSSFDRFVYYKHLNEINLNSISSPAYNYYYNSRFYNVKIGKKSFYSYGNLIGGFKRDINEDIDLYYALMIKKNKIKYAKKHYINSNYRIIPDNYLELLIKPTIHPVFKDILNKSYEKIDIIKTDNINEHVFVNIKSPEFQTIDHHKKWLINRSKEFRKRERIVI
ncbi:MAG: hypothetical protein V3V33_16495 [Candidatus Lokiarchaeia archaeon]